MYIRSTIKQYIVKGQGTEIGTTIVHKIFAVWLVASISTQFIWSILFVVMSLWQTNMVKTAHQITIPGGVTIVFI